MSSVARIDVPHSAPLEIAHVLFMDIVGYSKLPMDSQQAVLQELQESVQRGSEFKRAQGSREGLIRIPTGDGMALVFFGDPELPARCALELSSELRQHPDISLRMGIHSGPVYRIADINRNNNVAGGGINFAQRVMDCGDRGHILVSKTVADILGQLSSWAGLLHDLGEIEAKHGIRVHVYNLYTNGVGNASIPHKFTVAPTQAKPEGIRHAVRTRTLGLAVTILVLACVGVAIVKLYHSTKPQAPTAIRHLAVLPFRVVGEDEVLRPVADGFVETLCTKFLAFDQIQTLPAERTLRLDWKVPPEVAAKKLKADLLIWGVVQGSREKMRTTVHLFDSIVGREVWAKDFSGSAQDALLMQDAVFRDLTAGLKLPSPPQGPDDGSYPTKDGDAYDFYLQGRYAMRHPQDIRNVEAAEKSYTRALKLDPKFALSYAGLADAYLEMHVQKGDAIWADKALNAAKQAEQLDEKRPETHLSLGAVYSAKGDSESAIRELKYALKLRPKDQAAYRRLGDTYAVVGNKQEAVRNYEQAIRLDPYYSFNYSELAAALLQFGDYAGALNAYNKIVEIEPSSAVGYSGKGAVYLEQGKWEDAIQWFEQASKLQSSADIYSNLGTAYFSLARYEEAVEQFRRAVDLSPHTADYVGNLADAYRWSGHRDEANAGYKKAIDLCYQQLQVNAHDYRIIVLLASYYAKAGKMPRALEYIREASKQDSEDPGAMYIEAQVYAIAGRREEAISALQKSFQLGVSPRQAATDPELATLRTTPEYQELAGKFPH